MSLHTDPLGELDCVDYDPATDAYHVQYDWEDSASLCSTVVRTVSAATGQAPTAMAPLYSVFDPDALESLLAPTRDRDVELSFTFEGCRVTVAGSGDVVVGPEE
jgi:hypothetical protein